jgi:hypothetical protein
LILKNNKNNMKLKITSLIICIGLALNLQAQQNFFRGNNNYAAPVAVIVDGAIVTSGLIVHLNAGNTDSYSGLGTTWTDLSGNGNNATLFGGVGYNAANGGSLVFDGVNDYVRSINASSYTNLTIEIWIYDTRSSGERDILTYNGNLGSFVFNGSVFRTDGDFLGARSFAGAGNPPVNNWYRFLYIKDSDLYLNNTKYTGSGSDRTYGILDFGATRSGVNSLLNGRIASVKVYNRSLTAAEITQNFNATKARFGL